MCTVFYPITLARAAIRGHMSACKADDGDGPWLSVMSKRYPGRVYYYNSVSGRSSWARPAGHDQSVLEQTGHRKRRESFKKDKVKHDHRHNSCVQQGSPYKCTNTLCKKVECKALVSAKREGISEEGKQWATDHVNKRCSTLWSTTGIAQSKRKLSGGRILPGSSSQHLQRLHRSLMEMSGSNSNINERDSSELQRKRPHVVHCPSRMSTGSSNKDQPPIGPAMEAVPVKVQLLAHRRLKHRGTTTSEEHGKHNPPVDHAGTVDSTKTVFTFSKAILAVPKLEEPTSLLVAKSKHSRRRRSGNRAAARLERLKKSLLEAQPKVEAEEEESHVLKAKNRCLNVDQEPYEAQGPVACKGANKQEGKQREKLPGLAVEPVPGCSHSGAEVSVNSSAGVDAESMDWEPTEMEQLVKDIYKFRDEVCSAGGISQFGSSAVHVADGPEMLAVVLDAECAAKEWFIVIDTNVFVANLNYVEELLVMYHKSLGSPVLVVPWYVLQELDCLKDHRGKAKLAGQARRAVTFLRAHLAKHPRIRGQSASDANWHKQQSADDGILECCMQLSQRGLHVMLLSNDKNLCNKAVVNNIQSYSAVELQMELETTVTHLQMGSQLTTNGTDLHMLATDMKENKSSADELARVDAVFSQLEAYLKELLVVVVERELEKVYGNLWLRVVVVKPPWSLSDVFTCVIKHWIAVFGLVFPRSTKLAFEMLRDDLIAITNRLRKKKKKKQQQQAGQEENGTRTWSLEFARDIVHRSKDICLLVPPEEYRQQVDKCCQVMEELLSTMSDKQESVGEFALVKERMESMWVQATIFCGVACDTVGLPHTITYDRPVPFPSVSDVSLRVQGFLEQLHTVISNIKRVLEIPLGTITATHPTLAAFQCLLANAGSVQGAPSASTVALFCLQEDCRVLLEKGKEGFQQLEAMTMEAAGYLVYLCASPAAAPLS